MNETASAQPSYSTAPEQAEANTHGEDGLTTSHRVQDDDEDDDEKLFAQLDEELDLMNDEYNYDGSSATANGNSDTVASFDMAEFRERRMQEIKQE